MSDDEILALIREALLYAAPEQADRFQNIEWSSTLASLNLN